MSITPHRLVLAAALALAGCIDQPGAAPAEPGPDAGAAASPVLPDGTRGVDRVKWRDQVIEVPWIARAGEKWTDDDFAIGPATDTGSERAAWSTSMTPWANDHVPYCVWRDWQVPPPYGLSASDESTIDSALTALAAITPLHFDKFGCLDASRPSRYIDYHGCTDGCTNASTHPATVHDGYYIQLTGFSQRTIWHETGHALGFKHEQDRYDRPGFVKFYSGCLDNPSHADQFTQSTDPATDALSPYDIDSVMQYPSSSFSKDDPACPPLLATGGSSSPPYYGYYPGVGYLYGTYINKSKQDSLEDLNAIYQIYEPVLGKVEQNDRLGGAMVSADFDGDGYDDLAVGAMTEAPGSHPASGGVFLYKGTMNGLVAWKFLGEGDFPGTTQQAADGFGVALAAADVDGDGAAELFVGAQMYGSARGGAVFVYKGGRGGPAALQLLQQSGSGAGTSEYEDFFGAALAAGKLAGGSTVYLAVGVPYEGPSSGNARGEVDLFRWNGSSFAWSQDLTAGSYAANGDLFGSALAIGNADSDSYADLLVGAPQDYVGPGYVYLFQHASTGLTLTARTTAPSPGTDDRFGTAVAFQRSPGNVDVMVVGAPGKNSGTGRAYQHVLFYGALVEYAELKQSDISGETGHAGDMFGSEIAAGDLDGDGKDDLAIAAPNKPESGVTGAGAVDLFFTSATDKVKVPSTPTTYDTYGSAIAIGNFDRGAQSVKGNGRNDLAIGIPGRTISGTSAAGTFDVYQGTSQSFWRNFNEGTSNGP